MSQNRRLIVNADDFGRSSGINHGILMAHDQGIVTSTSAMVRWPAIAEAAIEAAKRPKLSVGLHVDLGEWTLVGNQWVAVYEVTEIANERAVTVEVEQQLAAFREMFGRDPTHLDSHQHVHKKEPVQSILREIALRFGLPLRHFTPQVHYCGAFYGQDAEGHLINSALTVEALSRILESLSPGCTELTCHPAEKCDIDSMYSHERLAELGVLCDPRLPALLHRLQIQLCSFVDLRCGLNEFAIY